MNIYTFKTDKYYTDIICFHFPESPAEMSLSLEHIQTLAHRTLATIGNSNFAP